MEHFEQLLTGTEGPLLLAIVIALLVIPVLIFLLLRQRSRVEHPVRLQNFLEVGRSLNWSDSGMAPQELDRLTNAFVDLLRAEVEYYYRTRSTRRLTAGMFRWGAFVLASVGLTLPLLATAIPRMEGISDFGFVALALSAACLAGNELFGSTRGHIRSVTTQYKLERLIARFSLNYQELRLSLVSEGRIESGFNLLRTVAEEAYAILEGETKAWADAQTAAEAAYGQGVVRRPEKG